MIRSAQAEIGKLEGRKVGQAALSDLCPRAALDHDCYADDLGACLLKCVNCREHGIPGGGRVLHGEDTSARDIRAFNPALQAVRLLGLAHDKRIELFAARRGGVQHCGSNRIRAKGQAANGVIRQASGGIQHDPASYRGSPAVEQDPPEVDIPIRALS